jgi:hypothetical protein|uniref:Uncharacterized protein n=2 Tax=Oryza TaxID=4527 RepID=Q8H5F9_ORYSJ|nr:hypothetical protein [Oryza sativa Japonica Group]BAD30299.1 hypothetical protein [Oryza sativa Japonica Group]
MIGIPNGRRALSTRRCSPTPVSTSFLYTERNGEKRRSREMRLLVEQEEEEEADDGGGARRRRGMEADGVACVMVMARMGIGGSGGRGGRMGWIRMLNGER